MALNGRRYRSRTSGGPDGDLLRWYRGVRTSIEQATIEEADDFARDGAEFMREFIRTRGTKHSGKAGRIDTGPMLNAVGSRSATGAGRSASFGWLRDRAAYFLYQEGGFFNTWAQRSVEGMYALSDAAELAAARFNARMKRRGARRRG